MTEAERVRDPTSCPGSLSHELQTVPGGADRADPFRRRWHFRTKSTAGGYRRFGSRCRSRDGRAAGHGRAERVLPVGLRDLRAEQLCVLDLAGRGRADATGAGVRDPRRASQRLGHGRAGEPIQRSRRRAQGVHGHPAGAEARWETNRPRGEAGGPEYPALRRPQGGAFPGDLRRRLRRGVRRPARQIAPRARAHAQGRRDRQDGPHGFAGGRPAGGERERHRKRGVRGPGEGGERVLQLSAVRHGGAPNGLDPHLAEADARQGRGHRHDGAGRLLPSLHERRDAYRRDRSSIAGRGETREGVQRDVEPDPAKREAGPDRPRGGLRGQEGTSGRERGGRLDRHVRVLGRSSAFRPRGGKASS